MATNEKPQSMSNTRPGISFVMPCYNEEEIISYTINQLLTTFRKAGYRIELIGVDNGSSDRTGEIIRRFAAENTEVICHRVEKNEGYGNGILRGLPLCTAPWVGIIPADAQVDAEDAVRLYEAVAATNGRVLGKVRRRFRMDGLRRKIVSIAYNFFVLILWPRIGTLDVNGLPKVLPREVILAMDLKSKGWLLDPEIMIKAHYMGIRVLEFNVFARMRGSGISHVNIEACWEFFWNLLVMRLTGRWAHDLEQSPTQIRGKPSTSLTPPAGPLS